MKSVRGFFEGIQSNLPNINFHKWFTSPWLIVVSILLGGLIGWSHDETLIKLVAPIGQLYLSLFKMCVLPILLSGITMSIGRLMNRKDAASYIQRIAIFFPLFLLATSAITLVLGIIFAPGRHLDNETLQKLGVLVNQSGIDLEVSLTGDLKPVPESPGLASFFLGLVPTNIFGALTDDKTLQVLFFVIILGIGLGFVPRSSSEPFLLILEGVYGAFNRVIHWLRYLLPFGLCGLLAQQLAKVGVDTIFVMSHFIVLAVATFLFFGILNTLLIWLRAETSLLKVIQATKEPVLLAIATQSSLACLPSAIDSLSSELKFDNKSTNLVLPLALTLCRFGSVMYFVLTSLFVADLYKSNLGLGGLVTVLVGSIFAGMATSGVSGILTLTMLNLVLTPLGLPLDAVLVLFIAIDPLLDPFRTMAIVHSAIALTSFVADRNSDYTPNGDRRHESRDAGMEEFYSKDQSGGL